MTEPQPITWLEPESEAVGEAEQMWHESANDDDIIHTLKEGGADLSHVYQYGGTEFFSYMKHLENIGKY